MSKTAMAVAVAAMVSLVAAAGCGGGEGGGTPREQGMQSTYQGSYQVKGVEEGRTLGVGIYDDGSFRIIIEGSPRMVIHNEESGENWLISLSQKNYQSISYDEALIQAGFMPGISMEAYFEFDQFWNGAEFRMDTADGRTILAYLDGPEYLPGAWEVQQDGRTFKSVSWEYRRVGRVSPANFVLPDGLTPRE
jgi:hypothetical protein